MALLSEGSVCELVVIGRSVHPRYAPSRGCASVQEAAKRRDILKIYEAPHCGSVSPITGIKVVYDYLIGNIITSRCGAFLRRTCVKEMTHNLCIHTSPFCQACHGHDRGTPRSSLFSLYTERENISLLCASQ